MEFQPENPLQASIILAATDQILLGQPRTYPRELTAALSASFKSRKQIKRAYLALIKRSKDEHAAHTLIGLEVSGDWDTALNGVGAAINGFMIPDPPINFIRLGQNGTVDQYFEANCVPFYKKRFF